MMARVAAFLLIIPTLSACAGTVQRGQEWCKTAKICTCLYNRCEDVKH
jgi:hypothetical protein